MNMAAGCNRRSLPASAARSCTPSPDVLDYHRERVLRKGGATRDAVARVLSEAGVQPQFRVTDTEGRAVQGVETHLFRNGAVTLVALLSNPDLRVDELGPPDFRSNENFAHRKSLRLALPEELAVYDVRGAKSLGKIRELNVELDPYEPLIYAVCRELIPDLTLSAPARVARGETGRARISFGAGTPAAIHILHVEVTDPAGQLVRHYSGNVRAPLGHAVWELPIAHNDATGTWHLRAHDLLSGQTRTASIEVF